VLLGLGAYAIWAMFPIYMQLLAAVPPVEIVAQRILWSVLLLAVIVTLMRRWRTIAEALRDPRLIGLLCLSATLIAVNWLVYIWAVLHNHVLATSLGYFINPLVNVGLGMILLGERLRRLQLWAVGLAGIGVAALALAGGAALLIALALALSFGSYGLVRKIAPVDALAGLLIETAVLAPLAAAWLLWLGPTPAFGADLGQDILLALSGVITAVPLLLFAAAAKRMRYATLGLLQYLTPSLLFLQAVLLFGEELRPVHFFTFACIWTGVALYAWDSLRGGAALPATTD
jgi:chloramphenicol-sensitive protein RarD